MKNIDSKLKNFFIRGIWEIDTGSLGKFRSFIVKSIRLLQVTIREFTEGQLTLRAMSLVYSALLSVVPLLAISFSVLKGFGVHNQVVEPFLLKLLDPLGSRGVEITQKIISFVENVKVGVLGTVGLALLVYTVISVIQKIEKAFNYIWRIKKSRSLARRFSDYTSVILIGPILIFSAIGLTASFKSAAIVQRLLSIEPFGTFFYLASLVLPYVFVCSAFTVIYILIPNTKVKFRSALIGGIFAGVVWEATGWAFASFVVSSTKYSAIYSGFAILIMFMIWLYLSWLILLAGAQISFYHQYPQFLTAKKEVFRLNNRLREKLTFLIMILIGYNYYHNKQAWTLDSIVVHLGLPFEPVQEVLQLLENSKLILETHDEPPAYLPARDMETITLKELLDSVRVAEKETHSIESRVDAIQEVDGVIKGLDEAIKNALEDKTVKSLVLSVRKDV